MTRQRVADIHRGWETLPFAGMEAFFGVGRIMILAPHADDESLGCGGLIAQCCRYNRPPVIVFVTDGTGSHPNSPSTPPAALRRLREAEAEEALRRLGHDDPDAIIFLGLRDTAAPHHGPVFNAAMARISLLAKGCTTICAPWHHDPHCDHVATDLLAQGVAACTGMRHLSYPVWGWTLPPQLEIDEPPVDGIRLNIADVLPAKKTAIAAYRSQLGKIIHDDPSGFELPANLLHVFERPFEVYLKP